MHADVYECARVIYDAIFPEREGYQPFGAAQDNYASEYQTAVIAAEAVTHWHAERARRSVEGAQLEGRLALATGMKAVLEGLRERRKARAGQP